MTDYDPRLPGVSKLQKLPARKLTRQPSAGKVVATHTGKFAEIERYDDLGRLVQWQFVQWE